MEWKTACSLKPLCTVALWVLSITLMVFAIVGGLDDLERIALMVEVLACVPTGWLIVEAAVSRAIDIERIRTDAVIERVAQQFAEAELTRIR